MQGPRDHAAPGFPGQTSREPSLGGWVCFPWAGLLYSTEAD